MLMIELQAQYIPDVPAVTEQRPAAPGGAIRSTPTVSSQPYRIQAALPNGQPTSSQDLLEDGQLFFAIDWSADAGEQYEPERIEQPQLHASVEEAKAAQAAGPKPYTLDECIEVPEQPSLKCVSVRNAKFVLRLSTLATHLRKAYE